MIIRKESPFNEDFEINTVTHDDGYSNKPTITYHICKETQGNYDHIAETQKCGETEKAICLDGEWFPKSQIREQRSQMDGSIMIVFTDWILGEKGLF